MLEAFHGLVQYFHPHAASSPSTPQTTMNGRAVSVGTGEERQALSEGRNQVFQALYGLFQHLCPRTASTPTSHPSEPLWSIAEPPTAPATTGDHEGQLLEAAVELRLAAERGDLERVKELAGLLGTAKAINQTLPDGATALMLAAQNGHAECVQVLADLLKTPEAINQARPDGATALKLAAQDGHIDCVKVLASVLKTPEAINYAPDGFSALVFAARHGQTDSVKVLAGQLKTPEAINQARATGITALMYAARHGYIETVRVLVQALQNYPGSINAFARRGITALSAANRQGHDAIVALLLEALAANGRPLHTTDAVDHETVRIAGSRGHFGVLFSWLSSGGSEELAETFFTALDTANFNQQDHPDILLRAAELGHANVVSKLLERGANARWRREDGLGALSLAVRNGHLSVLDAWMAHGHAVSHELILETMRATGLYGNNATLNSIDATHATVLMKVASNGWAHLAEALIEMKKETLAPG